MSKIAKIVSRNVTPKHAHDCSCCRFLGSLDGQDLYHCLLGKALVRRFGSNGPDYGSVDHDFSPEGTAYSLAQQLRFAREDATALGRAFTPNAYRTVER